MIIIPFGLLMHLTYIWDWTNNPFNKYKMNKKNKIKKYKKNKNKI